MVSAEGVDGPDIEPTLRAWVPDIAEVRADLFPSPRGIWRWGVRLAGVLTPLADRAPRIVTVRFGERP